MPDDIAGTGNPAPSEPQPPSQPQPPSPPQPGTSGFPGESGLPDASGFPGISGFPGESGLPDADDPYAGRPWLGSYDAGVPADVDAPDATLVDLLDLAARNHPQAPALSFFGATLTYTELRDQVDALAGELHRLGVATADRVALLLPDCPQHVIAFFAVSRLGAVVVELNPLFTAPELTQALADCGAELAVCIDRAFPDVDAARESGRTRLRDVIVTSLADGLPARDRIMLRLPGKATRRRRVQLRAGLPAGARMRRFTSLVRLGRSSPRRDPSPAAPGDVAVLVYTAGTTGPAKGAMLTHRSLVTNAAQCRAWMPDLAEAGETLLCVLPMFHAYGLTVCLTLGMLLAAHLVLVPRFDPDIVFAAARRHRPTVFPGVPPVFQALVTDPRTRAGGLASVRVSISGAMRMPPALATLWPAVTSGPLVEGYGLTEASPVTHCNPVAAPPRPGWVGLPLPSTECRVVDPDDPGRLVPVGETGELAVRGPQLFAGYWNWNDPTSTVATETADGWLRTGDVVRMDAGGWFQVVDRLTDVVIVGGFNVYPGEVEAVLASMPQVAEVAVVGAPDRFRGETLRAVIVLRPGEELSTEEVQAFAATSLAPYKIPRIVEFRSEPLPKARTIGRVSRAALRDPGCTGKE